MANHAYKGMVRARVSESNYDGYASSSTENHLITSQRR